MANTRRPQRPIGLATRSFKVDFDIWERLKARATAENVSMTYVLTVLAEGYGRGLIDLPKQQLVYNNGTVEKE